MDVIIPRNTSVPVKVTKSYSTAHDNQESVEVKVYQGEHPKAANNIRLGSLMLKGIEPAPAGEPEVNVTFQVDQDSILHVTAEDVNTANRKEITITDSVRLSEAEITEMVHQVEADADKGERKA
jgi:molecular chaperone DnaK